MDKLYPLGSKDIEAIGKARVGRSLPKNVKRWLYGGFIVCIAGFFIWVTPQLKWLGVGVVVVGASAVWYGSFLADKVRGKVIGQLKREWREENKQ